VSGAQFPYRSERMGPHFAGDFVFILQKNPVMDEFHLDLCYVFCIMRREFGDACNGWLARDQD
jgi:hypothetical protein